MTIKIIGAGMTGMLAAHILKERQPVIVERNSSIFDPERRMRFRTPVLSRYCDQPLDMVVVEKAYEKWRNPIADAMSYSRKCYGISINVAEIMLSNGMHTRYVSKPDLVSKLAEGLSIEFNTEFDFALKPKDEPVISTLPMPVLMAKLGYRSELSFKTYRNIRVRARVKDFDAYLSLLLPSPRTIASRVIMMGNELEVEIPRPEIPEKKINAYLASWSTADWENCARRAMETIGDNSPVFDEKPMAEVDAHPRFLTNELAERTKFLNWARTEFNIFSVGKFANWWPSLSVEDVASQVNEINTQLANGGRLN